MKEAVVFVSDVYTSLGLIRCLGEKGIRPFVVAYGPKAKDLFLSKYPMGGVQFAEIFEAVEYLLNEYPVKDDKPVLFTLPDLPAYHVDMHLDELNRKFIIMNAKYAGAIAELMDKTYQGELAVRHGLVIPHTIVLKRGDPIPPNLDYPVFTKSLKTVDGGKCDEAICSNEAELNKMLKCLKAETCLISRYINKRKEVNYFGLSKNGMVYIDYHDERTRFPKDKYGHYNIFHRCNKDDFHKKLVSIIKETNYEGVFDIEFIQDENDVLYFMEINFRCDGALYKLSPGVNLPFEWIKLSCLTEEEMPTSLSLGKTQFTGMTELQDFYNSVIKQRFNFFVWLYQFFTADKHMIFSIYDSKPFVFGIWNMIKTRFFK